MDHIGLIFQTFNLVPWLSAEENVLLPCRFSERRRNWAGGDPAGAARRLLRELGLDPDLFARPALIGMVIMLSATLDARRREFAILGSVGATPAQILGLIVAEAAILTVAGLIIGVTLLTAVTALADPILSARVGLRLGFDLFGRWELAIVALFVVAGLATSLVPPIRVYRMTLSDGLSVRM